METISSPLPVTSSWIKTEALLAGFDAVRITKALFHEKGFQRLTAWLGEQAHAGMTYMENPSVRANPKQLLPNAESVILLAKNYRKEPKGESDALIADYVSETDYHLEIGNRLRQFISKIEEQAPGAAFKPFVDSTPLLERAFAESAGLGFFGKNTLLIHKTLGSKFFISGILTSLPLEADAEEYHGSCGSCTACLDACPTGALEEPYFLNASKCISYLTIEHQGPIEESLRPQMGNWVFGCDVCQDVCPHNRSKTKKTSSEPEFSIPLETLLSFRSNKEFDRHFENNAMIRPHRKGLMRNACIAAGNSKNPKWLPFLTGLTETDPIALVRESAAWAIREIEGASEKIL